MSDLSSNRYVFIDLFRGAAVLFMLQGHVFRALIDPSIQQHPAYSFHDLFHGVTAPAFLFGAGLTFVISTRKRWEAYHHFSRHFLRRIGRMVIVILLGTALHLPYFSLRKIITEGTSNDYLLLFQCDVLHCIGLGLLTLQALIFFFKTERRFYGFALVSGTVVPLLTPLVWDIDFLRLYPPAIAQLFNSMHGSPFPLFPFVGFLIAGVIVSWEFQLAAERQSSESEEAPDPQRRFMRRLLWLGPVLITCGLLFNALPLQLYPTVNFWYTSPNYFLIRIGVLLLITAGIWHAANLLQRQSLSGGFWRSITGAFTLMGKESLLVYVLHLVILYGSVINADFNIRGFVGTHLNLLEASGVLILFTAGLLAAAWGWNALKNKKPFLYRIVQYTAAVVFLGIFVIRAY